MEHSSSPYTENPIKQKINFKTLPFQQYNIAKGNLENSQPKKVSTTRDYNDTPGTLVMAEQNYSAVPDNESSVKNRKSPRKYPSK